jgi:hypothetical protein
MIACCVENENSESSVKIVDEHLNDRQESALADDFRTSSFGGGIEHLSLYAAEMVPVKFGHRT